MKPPTRSEGLFFALSCASGDARESLGSCGQLRFQFERVVRDGCVSEEASGANQVTGNTFLHPTQECQTSTQLAPFIHTSVVYRLNNINGHILRVFGDPSTTSEEDLVRVSLWKMSREVKCLESRAGLCWRQDSQMQAA